MTFTIVMLYFLVTGDFTSENHNGIGFILFPIIIPIGMIAYIGKDAIGGQSLGKRVLGIMVRDSQFHDEIPSIKRLFQRNLTLVFWPFEYFELSKLPNSQRRGDRIANTIVLQYKERPKSIKYIVIGLGIFGTFILGIFLLVSSMFLNSEPYKLSLKEIENNQEIKSEIGSITGYGFMPTGSINVTNGVGTANFCINVKGSIKTKTVCTELHKKRKGKWELTKIE